MEGLEVQERAMVAHDVKFRQLGGLLNHVIRLFVAQLKKLAAEGSVLIRGYIHSPVVQLSKWWTIC
jgi:hypothetical protein